MHSSLWEELSLYRDRTSFETNLRIDGGDGVELGVVVERLGEPPDGRLLALPLHPTVQHPLAAALQASTTVAFDLKRTTTISNHN